jgi:hypothetical protein
MATAFHFLRENIFPESDFLDTSEVGAAADAVAPDAVVAAAAAGDAVG